MLKHRKMALLSIASNGKIMISKQMYANIPRQIRFHDQTFRHRDTVMFSNTAVLMTDFILQYFSLVLVHFKITR